MMRGRGRGGYGGRGRATNTAMLRTQVVSREIANSARRLQKDYAELANAKEPIVGVSAKPLPNDMYTWHGNLRGPAGTKWESGVFHFTMTIPKNYPCSPPSVTLCSPIPHPNVFGNTICLDMFGATSQIYQGWVPAYTIEGVLIQLQSFLFETLPEDIEKTKNILIGYAVKQANDYVCSTCKHRGPLSADPPFNKKEKNEEEFVLAESPKQLLRNELVCFNTRMPLLEGTLGVGITLKKSPRTGLCMYVNPTLDLMNMRSFTKLKVRKSLENERFTHWLPLYFGENEVFTIESENYDHQVQDMVVTKKTVNTKERFEKHLGNSLSFIANGSTTKPYDHKSVMEVMPKLISTHIIDLMKENKHISIIAIRRVFNFIRLFAHLVSKDDKILHDLDSRLGTFVSDPGMRNKENCKILLDLQVFAILSKTHDYQNFNQLYTDEQLDRQVLWILKEIPELDFENKKINKISKVNEKDRSRVSFECGKTGFYLTLFFHHLNQVISKATGGSGDLQDLAKVLDSNHGCLSSELENEFQQTLFKISEVNDFFQYYAQLGIQKIETDKQLNERLVQAVKNSRAKGYHGEGCDGTKLSGAVEQSQTRIQNLLAQFTDLKIQKEEIKKDIVTDGQSTDEEGEGPKFIQHCQGITLKASLKNAKEEDWKKLCIQNFEFIQQEFESNKDRNLTAAKFANQSDYEEINLMRLQAKEVKEDQDKLIAELQSGLRQDQKKSIANQTLQEDYGTSFTYRRLFVKLVFEFLQRDLQYNHDFEILYEYIKTFGTELTSVKMKIIDKMSLKSNHYWILALIPKLKSLKSLKMYQNEANTFGNDGYKFMQKAFRYFQKNGGLIENFQVSNVIAYQYTDNLYPILKCIPNLQILNFQNNTLTKENCKAIGKVLSDFKNIRELNLRSCGLNKESSKEIADGLMRAKQIEILNLSYNVALDVSQIIYNLAFSPKIRVIDVTNNIADAHVVPTVEAFYKLLKISGSIETLLLGGSNIIKSLSVEFCQALGENKTLESLDLDRPVNVDKSHTMTNIGLLGQGIAMNNRKNGSLHHLSIRNTNWDLNKIEGFWTAMRISEKDHELWYGETKIAQEMTHEQLNKKLHWGLQFLDLGGSSFGASNFKVKKYEIQSEPNWPRFIKTLGEIDLPVLDLRKSDIKASLSNIEILTCAIGKNPVGPCKIQVLNLANNQITQTGAKLLAPALEANNSIEFIDLSSNHLGVYGVTLVARALQKNSTVKGLNVFKNTIDVDGARALRDMLKVNKTIEFLDIGHNRIRSKGLEAITEGILEGVTSSVKSLGLRMNFINDDGLARFFDEVIFSGMSQIQNLYITQNNLTDYKAQNLSQTLQNQEIKVYVDQFEKLLYQKDDKMARTLWFGPLAPGYFENAVTRVNMIKQFRVSKTGLFKLPFRFKDAKKIRGKTSRSNAYMFVEFEDEASIVKVTKLVSTGKLNFARKCFRAGTNTFVQIRRSVRK